MIHKILAIAVIAVFGIGSGAAQAKNGWYATLGAGVSILQDPDIEQGIVKLETDSSVGPVVFGAVGKKFNTFRVEGEISYRQNDINEITSGTALGTTIPLNASIDGDVTTVGFMLNAAYDFRPDKKWSPYILAGIGGAYVSANDLTFSGTLLADDSTFEFAYQAGAGLNYKINEKVSLGLSYRFFGTTDPELDDAAGVKFDTEYQTHNFLVGLTYSF